MRHVLVLLWVLFWSVPSAMGEERGQERNSTR